VQKRARDFIATREERRVRAQRSVRSGRARERERKSIINKFENCFHQWLLHVLFTRIDIRRTRFDSRPEIDDLNEVCFRRLRLFPPRFRDLARPQNRLDNVNTVCFRRLWLFLLIPGSCDLRIDDVNKFCFRRLRFRPRFWEPGETAGIGPRLPGVIAGGNVGGGAGCCRRMCSREFGFRKRASRVYTMYHCCGRVLFYSYPQGKCMDEVLGRVCLPSG
jgi:hypothetical protein